MKLRALFLYSFLMLTPACNSIQNYNSSVIGIAKNAKMGAIVITAENKIYYLGGVESWGSEFLERKVRVTGRIVSKKIKQKDDTVIRIQKITGSSITVIQKATFQLIDKN